MSILYQHWIAALPKETEGLGSGKVEGFLLVIAIVLALVFVNTSFKPAFDLLHHTPVHIRIGPLILDRHLIEWVNDGLMVFFFIYITLEIRRALLHQQRSVRSAMALPAAAAFGGIVVPALIYGIINWNEPSTFQGWGIPVATDVVLVLAALSFFSDRTPPSLPLFLVSLAVFDDLGGILIIAGFYGDTLHWQPIALATFPLLALVGLNRGRVEGVTPYVLAGLALWVALLQSGIHPTLAGVAVGLAYPVQNNVGLEIKPSSGLRHWVSYCIVPLFGFLNAGIVFAELTGESFIHPVTVGIFLGLFIGKPLGILIACAATVAMGWARIPDDLSLNHLTAAAFLAGIGFTMSLFISSLAFDGTSTASLGRLGVLSASLAAGLVGALLLMMTKRRPVSRQT